MDFDKAGTGALVLSILGALLGTPAAAYGQAALPENAGVAETARYEAVAQPSPLPGFQSEQGRRSPLGAAVLGAYVPLAGYAYAGDWRRGLAPQALWFTFVGGMAYAGGCVTGGADEECSGTQETVGALAWTAGAVSVFWGGIGAFRTARSHNRALEERLRVEAGPGSDGDLSVGVRVILFR